MTKIDQSYILYPNQISSTEYSSAWKKNSKLFEPTEFEIALQ